MDRHFSVLESNVPTRGLVYSKAVELLLVPRSLILVVVVLFESLIHL
jgi:hypothetical protein